MTYIFYELETKITAVIMSIVVFLMTMLGFGVVKYEDVQGTAITATKREIINKYTEVVNQLKTDAPGYYKIDFQDVDEESVSEPNSLMVRVITGFLTDEQTARYEVRPVAAGTDMKDSFPVYGNSKGCLPISTSKVKSAKYVDLGNGFYRIEIVLKDEVNPKPAKAGATKAPSAHGAMFAPSDYSFADIPLITFEKAELTYTECTTSIVFEPETNHMISWKQIMNIDADITALFDTESMDKTEVDLSAYFTQTMIATNFTYK